MERFTQKRGKFRMDKWLISGYILFVFILIISIFPDVLSQEQSQKDKLQDKKKKIEEEIKQYKKLLSETKKNKDLTLNQVNLLKNQIEKRQELIEEINTEVNVLSDQIQDNNKLLDLQEKNLKAMKEEYASMVYYSWIHRHSADRLMFIFAAKDFNQAFERLSYFKQYDEYRRRQVQLILETKGQIKRRNEELSQQKQNKNNLLTNNEEEKSKLALEKSEQDAAVKKLKKKEAELKKKLKAREDEAKKLKTKIEAVIAAEIKKSAEKSKKEVSSGTTIKSVLTPVEKIVSDDFISNKGVLPWPVEKGAVSSTYGEHPHAVLDGIKVKNNGIDIATSPNVSARAIFGGEVASVVLIANHNNAVIIRHGGFFTVYSNLSSVIVSKGQKISIKQSLGTIYTDPTENKTELHFEIWEGKILCNPTDWLAKR